MSNLLAFLFTSMIIELMPGPNMAYLAILGMTHGRRAGFLAVAGVASGLLLVGLVAALGVAGLISNSPIAYHILRWSGVAYLLWLAWDGWRDSEDISAEEMDGHSGKYFLRGFVVNVLNPKAAVFYIMMLPSFIDKAANILAQTIILTIVYVLVATLVHSTIIIMTGKARAFFVSARAIVLIRKGLSLMLLGVAMWFMFSTGKSS